jgi:hypothetical protein
MSMMPRKMMLRKMTLRKMRREMMVISIKMMLTKKQAELLEKNGYAKGGLSHAERQNRT